MNGFLTSGLFFLVVSGVLFGAPPKTPINTRLVTVENDYLKVGVDLDHGGAITWVSAHADDTPKVWRGVNLVNNFDLGRQIQMSHYSGPVPFEPDGKKPSPHWRNLGWNAVQSGDHFGNGSEVLQHKVRGSRIEIETRPMQWPLDGFPSEAVFTTQIQLCGRKVIVAATIEMDREAVDSADQIVRHQEIPAVYLLSAFSRIYSPRDGKVVEIPQKPAAGSHWTYWNPTAPWAAAIDESGYGVGVYSRSAELFAGGLAGKAGSRDTSAAPTTYLAPIQSAALPSTGNFEYRFVICPGTLEELTERFKTVDKLSRGDQK